MAIFLEAAAARWIRGHAATAYPDECCGAFAGHERDGVRIVTNAWAVENEAEGDRRHRYVMGPLAYRLLEASARDKGVALLGFYHSHPDAPARPSAEDLRQAWPRVDYIIVSVVVGAPREITAWRLRDDREAFVSEEIAWQPES